LTGFDILPEVKKAILNIRKHKAVLNISTIISKINLSSIPDVIDLAFAFSANSISLNRFVPGGTGLEYIEELKPDKNDLSEILKIAQQKASKITTKVIFAIPMEDCEFEQSKYPNVKFGTCMCGQIKWTIDSVGNLRTCEQNPEIIGNLFSSSFKDLSESLTVKNFIINNQRDNCNQCAHLFLNVEVDAGFKIRN
jgi:MoaA/NifB/PqqE/SkfB family radical SAM enzyme